MIKLLLLAVVPFMTEHRNVAPRTVVSTNFYGSVTGIVDNAYIQAHGGGGVNTNAVLDIVRDEIIPATNDLDRALSAKIEAATPADYEEVKSKALSAIQVESDPTVPAWAKSATKPTYTAREVGALPLVEDSNGHKTAVTIGSRAGKIGEDRVADGGGVAAAGSSSHAEGFRATACGN